jgi:PAS domain S-box-containing protein
MTFSTDLFDAGTFATPQAAAEFVGNVLEASTEYSLIATDADGIIQLWNEGARRRYGYQSAEIVGQSWTLLHTDEDVRAGLPVTIAQHAVRDRKWDGIVQRVRKDGSQFTARVVVTPRHADGAAPGFLLMSSDMTEQVRLNSELRHAWAMIESAPDAMVVVDVAGEIQHANSEMEKLFGYARDRLVGEPVEMLMPTRYHARHPGHRGGFFTQPRSRPMGEGLELWGRREGGDEFPIEISLSPLETEHGVLVTAAIRDISERVRVERQLRDANVQLETANRAKDRFLASMSHELRTPLNAILGFTGTLLMELPGPLNDEQVKQLRIVQVNGRHLLSLINELLDLARIESGKIELNIEAIDCLELLDDVVLGLRPLADERHIGLDVDTSAEAMSVNTDRRALKQILINLTNNAIKFTDEGGVRLRLSRGGAAVPVTRFEVIDSGRGIKPDDQKHVFAAFEQIAVPTGGTFEGTGLGLYICQTLSKLIGGEITFTSEFGSGATFRLDLPDRVSA